MTVVKGMKLFFIINLIFLFTTSSVIAKPLRPKKTRTLKKNRRKKKRIKKKISKRLKKTEKKFAGGIHWRIKTKKGPVHVWVPKGYYRKTAGIVIYLHGYHTKVDKAIVDYKLLQKFKKSRQNAMFIIPETPSSQKEAVKWNSMTLLKRAVIRSNIRLPNGATVVIGHSGAFRTIRKWANHKLLAQIILLDAMYGGFNEFASFIKSGKHAKNHKLIIIGASTAKASKAFFKQYKFSVVRNNMPSAFRRFTKRQKSAKLLYIKSQYNHYQIVRNNTVIPVILRLTPLRLLKK
jgi:hypothetical protein